MPRIFISYRREDSGDAAGRICDHLRDRFGRGNVFMDVDSIPYGIDFRQHLAQARRGYVCGWSVHFFLFWCLEG